MMTLPSLLKRSALLHGARTAIYDAEGDLTWSAYVKRIARAAGMLCMALALVPFVVIGRVSSCWLLLGGGSPCRRPRNHAAGQLVNRLFGISRIIFASSP